MVPHNAFMGYLEVPSNVPLAEQKQKLKDKVIAHIDKLDKVDGHPVLHEDSDPVVYDEDGEWTYDDQTLVQTESGEMMTQAILDRPLGANPLLSASMFSPEGLCSEALVDQNGKCVTMQLAKLLKTSVAQIEKEIGSERVPAEATAEVAQSRGMPL